MNSKHPRSMSVLLTLCMILSMLFPMAASAAEKGINAEDITLYFIKEQDSDYLSLPDGSHTDFQLELSPADPQAAYSVKKGKSVDVTNQGLITVRYEYNYFNGYAPVEGASVIEVRSGSDTYEVTVNVKDYASEYVDKVMDDYLAQNITDDMTSYEKLKKIAEFISDYSYDYRCTSARDMIIRGGGDCYASTDAAVIMANKLGYDAWSRYGGHDDGSGSNHRNAMVYDGKDYYEVEAGYAAVAPRPNYVKKRSSLFTFVKTGSDTAEIVQYDGKTAPEEMVIPAEIDGYRITSIGENALTWKTDTKKIVLPDTLEKIGSYAFSHCEGLEEINIPASVTEIGDNPFVFSRGIKTIDTAGSKYVYDKGVLYEGGAKLISAPICESIKIPDTVTEIGADAFTGNYNIKTVIVPENVTLIGAGAFNICPKLRNLIIDSPVLKEIGELGFAKNYYLKVYVPKSVEKIGADLITGGTNNSLIVEKGSYAEQYAAENDLSFEYAPDAVLGDADGSGEAEVSDATVVQRCATNLRPPISKIFLNRGDVDSDGSLTVLDATFIQRSSTFVATPYPIGKAM